MAGLCGWSGGCLVSAGVVLCQVRNADEGLRGDKFFYSLFKAYGLCLLSSRDSLKFLSQKMG